MQAPPSTRRPLRRTITVLGLLATAAVLAAGCGGDDESDSGSADTSPATTETTETMEDTDTGAAPADDAAGAAVLELGAVSGELKFDKETLTAPAGTVTIKFTNPDTIPHNIAILQDDEEIGASELIAEDSVELTVDLEPGEYDFVCTPHIGAGMVGKLTVT